jgi:tetratricopeptide (TPR) repeat protein
VRRRLDSLQIPDDDLYSVRSVLSWSYARLDAGAAHAFRTLGLIPGVSIGAEAVAALLDVPLSAAAAALRSLAAQHLVEPTGSGFGSSYWMHDLTRIYAEEVSRSGETATARRQALERLLQWYVATLTQGYLSTSVRLPFALEAEPRHEPLRFSDQKELVAWCAREWDDIAPLVRTAQRIGRHDLAWQLAYLLFDYFYAAGQARDWIETLQTAMRSAETLGDLRAQAVLLNHLSVAHSRLGQNTIAVYQLKRGLQILEGLGDGDDVPRISLLGNLASTLREAKAYTAALPYARQALDLAQRAGMAYYEAGSLDVLSELHAELGDFEESLGYGRLGLTAARRCENTLLEANILINLGAAEHGLARAEMALRYFQDALSLCEAGGDRYHEALALFGLAKVHRAGSAWQPARDLASRALARFEELDTEEVADVMEFLEALDALGLDAAQSPTTTPAPAEGPTRRVG